MPTQRELDFADAEKERQIRLAAEEREAFVDAQIGPVVERHGPKEFASLLALGVEQVARIYHWIGRRNGQRPPAELLVAAHERDDEAFLSYCDRLGWERPAKRAQIPEAELVRRYRAALLQFGQKGVELDRQITSAPMPREPQEWETTARRAGGAA